MYQRKVDVDMLNAVKSVLVDVSGDSPLYSVQHSTAYSTVHSTAQHSTAQHSTAYSTVYSTAQHSSKLRSKARFSMLFNYNVDHPTKCAFDKKIHTFCLYSFFVGSLFSVF